MAYSDPIICRPTAWFVCRATIVALMFAVFTALFYIDGSVGYREKNRVFYLHQCFKEASRVFAEQNIDQKLTADQWVEYASSQWVKFPEDHTILPTNIDIPVPWPEILHDFERMKSLQWNQLWLDYSEVEGLAANPPEKSYDARSIREQWVFCFICAAISAISLYFLIKTSRRKIIACEDSFLSQNGLKISYSEMRQLDLRKWESKGIAFISYEGTAGNGRLRVDGLTYGGFKKDKGQPAEMLMQRIRSKFSGEILEYTSRTEKFTDKEEPAEQSK